MAYSSSNVPAASSMLDILRFLSRQRGPVAASLITQELNLPRSTMYHLLRVGVESEFILHYPEEQKYGLGPQAAEMSSAYARHAPIVRLATSLLPPMVDEAGENGHLSTIYGTDIVYLLAERARGKRSLVSTVGVRLPAHNTASGRAMLAWYSPEQLAATYSNAEVFAKPRNEGHVDGDTDQRGEVPMLQNLAELKDYLEQVRSRGFAEEESEVTSGLASMSVAVRDRTGWPLAAVTLTYSLNKTTSEKKDRLLKTVKRYAKILEKRITI